VKIDVLVAEIGSTTTTVNAFNALSTASPRFLGQGLNRTTVSEGDVRIGLEGAVASLKKNMGTDNLSWNSFFATSSAAGGLRMSVHGLVYNMTVRAAKEAALGAGANIHQITAGKMRDSDLEKLIRIKPHIILIAGGVDYGERDTALFNAEKICRALIKNNLCIPVVYAGNKENEEEMKRTFSGYAGRLTLLPNVYPKIDELVIEPARRLIQDLFEEHIIHAPGMNHIRDMVDGPILPTPGGVMLAAKLLKERIGDLLVFDVGGATTDIHSVTKGSDEVKLIQTSPEPEAKRTVEGDLGVFINRENILNKIEIKELSHSTVWKGEQLSEIITGLKALPVSDEEKKVVALLTEYALKKALRRHTGHYRDMYGERGRTRVAEGKDLTAVKYCIGTGGALTRSSDGCKIIKSVLSSSSEKNLYPRKDVECFIDHHYIMASTGVLSKIYPEAAVQLLSESLAIKNEGMN